MSEPEEYGGVDDLNGPPTSVAPVGALERRAGMAVAPDGGSPGPDRRGVRRPGRRADDLRGLKSGFERDISGPEGTEQGALQCSELLRRGATPLAPEKPKEVEVLPDRAFRSGIGVVARSDPPMEMGHPVTEGLNVQLPRLEGFVDRGSYLGHLFEVVASRAFIEIEDLPHALLGDEEHTPLEVLVRHQPDVAGFEPSNEPRISSVVGCCILGAKGAIRHRSSMATDPGLAR